MKVRTRNILIDSDYSAQEPHILVQFCDKQSSILDRDIYAHIASVAFNLPFEECLEYKDNHIYPEGKHRRDMAKKVLLGILYGQSIKSVAKELNCSLKEAQNIKDTIYAEIPNFEQFEISSQQQVKEKGYTTTIWGRRRHLPDYNLEPTDENKNAINKAKRQIINSRIQGSASDMIKKAILNIYSNETLQKMGIKVLLPIHDELIIKVPIKYQEEAKEIIEREMTHIDGFNIPLKCDITISDCWL